MSIGSMVDRFAQTFPEPNVTPDSCPVCVWPLSTVPAQKGSARYGAPDAEDEESVSDEPYLHALADVLRLRSVKRIKLCPRHQRELREIVTRDKTGKHPKQDRAITRAERRLAKAQEEAEAAEEALVKAKKTGTPERRR